MRNKNKRSANITSRMTEDEAKVARRLAKRAGMSLSDWLLEPRRKEIAAELATK